MGGGGWRQIDKEMEAKRLPFWNYKMLQAHAVQCLITSLLSKELSFLLLENRVLKTKIWELDMVEPKF